MAIPAAHPGGTRAAAPSRSSHSAHALPKGRQDMSLSLGADAEGASCSRERRGSPDSAFLKQGAENAAGAGSLALWRNSLVCGLLRGLGWACGGERGCWCLSSVWWGPQRWCLRD